MPLLQSSSSQGTGPWAGHVMVCVVNQQGLDSLELSPQCWGTLQEYSYQTATAGQGYLGAVRGWVLDSESSLRHILFTKGSCNQPDQWCYEWLTHQPEDETVPHWILSVSLSASQGCTGMAVHLPWDLPLPDMPIKKVPHIWGSTEINSHQKDPPRSCRPFILSSDIPRNCEVRGGSPPPCSVSGMAPQASPTGQSQRVDVPSGLLLFACPLCSHKSKSRDTSTEGDVFFSVRTDRIIHDKC